MRDISSLGISPAPWEVRDLIPLEGSDDPCGKWIVDGDGNDLITDIEGDGIDGITANAILIAEAPELYRCLCDAVNSRCRVCELVNEDGSCDQPDCDCVVQQWKRALAKASGEEEIK